MKKIFAFFMIAVLGFTCLACNEETPDPNENDGDNSIPTLAITETSLSLEIGETYTFNVDIEILMQSSNSSVVSTNESAKTVTANSVGEATVTIYALEDTTVSKSIVVTVTDPNANQGGDQTVKPESIEITSEVDSMYLEDTLQLTWKVLPEEASQEVTIVTASSSFIDLNTETGLVYAKNSGTATIKISCKEDKSVSAIIQINIKKTINPDKFFSDFVFENPVTEIVYAFGWAAGSTWEATLNGSVTKYLFEEITINQAFISTSLPTRPGTKMKYRFVVFHDTAGAGASENAAWTANYCANGAATRDSSWHFTVDSQSIYQTIPIDEIAWHAGCGTDVDLTFKDTKVPATSTEPAKVTISADGYFEMNGTKTTFKAPLKENGQIPTNENIPYTGIENYVNPQTGTYWIGNTWWSETYQHVGNYGGNLEGIAIESCVNKGNDIWKTWANSAKLIGSYILPESGLTPNAMRQHNSFSGKDCPMTMRHADRWEEFMELIKYEYAMYKYFQNFKVEFICDSPYILKNGLVKSLPAVETKIPCQIKVSCEAEDYNKTFDFTVTLGNQYTRNCNNDVPYMRG